MPEWIYEAVSKVSTSSVIITGTKLNILLSLPPEFPKITISVTQQRTLHMKYSKFKYQWGYCAKIFRDEGQF